jgi:O-antigen/teichoic acid export membrane protein
VSRYNIVGEFVSVRHVVSILSERASRAIALFAVTVVLARTLGPGSFGLVAGALALYSILTAIVGLGMAGTLAHASAGQSSPSGLLLGVVVAKIGTALVVVAVGLPIFASLSEFHWPVLAVVSLGLLFYSFESIDHYLQGREAFTLLAWIRLVTIAIVSVATISLCLAGYPIELLLAARLSEWLIFGLLAIALGVPILRPELASGVDLHGAMSLAKRSLPLVLSSLSAVLYLKLDQLMLLWMTNTEEVGRYAIASQLSEVWYIIPTAVGTILLPALTKLRSRDAASYSSELQAWSDRLVLWAILIALVMSLIATPLVAVVFGSGYAPAAGILQVHIWAGVFVFHRALVSKWIIMEGRMLLSLQTQSLGLVTNIALNLLLIPSYGGMGAAIATLVSYAMAGYIGLLIWPTGRPAARMFERTLLLPVRLLRRQGGS